jgi:hypothetical protein
VKDMMADSRPIKHLLFILSLLTAFVRAESPGKSIDLLNSKDLAAWQLITPPTTRVDELLPMHSAKFAEKLTTAPGAATRILERAAANSEKPLGEWNTCDIVCRGSSIEVTINGVLQNKVTPVPARRRQNRHPARRHAIRTAQFPPRPAQLAPVRAP